MPHSLTKYWLVNCKRSQREIRSPSQMRGTFVLKSARTIGRIETEANQLQPNSSGTHSSVSNTRLTHADTLLDETYTPPINYTKPVYIERRVRRKVLQIQILEKLQFGSEVGLKHFSIFRQVLFYIKMSPQFIYFRSYIV